MIEFSEAGAFGALSAVCTLMGQVQAKGEQIAWVETGKTLFFPPDLAFRGLDLEAISVILAPEVRAGLQGAQWLLRSGSFGLIVIDGISSAIDEAVLGRLARMAEDQRTAVVFLTRKKPTEPSLGTQLSLRGSIWLSSSGETMVQAVKDKRSGSTSPQKVSLHGPFGLY